MPDRTHRCLREHRSGNSTDLAPTLAAPAPLDTRLAQYDPNRAHAAKGKESRSQKYGLGANTSTHGMVSLCLLLHHYLHTCPTGCSFPCLRPGRFYDEFSRELGSCFNAGMQHSRISKRSCTTAEAARTHAAQQNQRAAMQHSRIRKQPCSTATSASRHTVQQSQQAYVQHSRISKQPCNTAEPASRHASQQNQRLSAVLSAQKDNTAGLRSGPIEPLPPSLPLSWFLPPAFLQSCCCHCCR